MHFDKHNKKYISYLTSNNVLKALSDNKKSLRNIISMNANEYKISQLELILKCEFYSNITPEKQLPIIIDFNYGVNYDDNFDSFFNKCSLELEKIIKRFLVKHQIEFCDLKLTNLCLDIKYDLPFDYKPSF